ncbi:MAG: ATP-binding cassette domain-containing protein, partial [Dongia sp.]
MLTIERLQVSYGSITALRGVDIAVGDGEIVAVIGPNGAGKSTLLLTLAGVVKAKGGHVTF